MGTQLLCEVTAGADSLAMKALVDLCSRALARMIEGKSPDEIRRTFNLPNDLTEVSALLRLSLSQKPVLYWSAVC